MTPDQPDLPLVSIIMSVYNAADTLLEAVDSILAQTYTNWEFVICDDASTDNTPSLLRQLAIQDPRIKVITNATNMRLAYSLNRCLEVTSGELIARMDGDDISECERLARQVNYLEENSEIDLVGSAMRRFNLEGDADIIHPASEHPDRWTMGRSSKAPFFHATIMAKRTVFDRVGNYTVAWRTQRAEDADLWFKFFAAGLKGRSLPEPLYKVREDAAAIRRRTAKVRLQSYLVYVKGARSLGYGPGAYVRSTANLTKIFVPYPLIDRFRARTAAKARSGSAGTKATA